MSEDCLTRRSAFEATLLLPGARCRIRERSLFHLIVAASIPRSNRQDGRVVKALDLSSNGRMSAWVRNPLLTRRRVITSTSRLHSVVAIISRECGRSTAPSALVRATWKRGVDCPVSEDCLTRRSIFEATLLLPGARCRIRERSLSHLIVAASIPRSNRQDGRVVKALDLSSNGRMSAWVRTPLLTRRRVITSTSRLHSVVAIISRECAIRARPCNVEARCRLPCV